MVAPTDCFLKPNEKFSKKTENIFTFSRGRVTIK